MLPAICLLAALAPHVEAPLAAAPSRVAALRAPLAPAGPLADQEESEPEERQTRHYQLRLALPPAEADDLARLLEAAWPSFKAFFQAEPRITDQRLELDLYPDQESWQSGILGDRTTPPAAADRSWFSSQTRKVYVYRSPIEYVTRAHVLYGACLQFHGMLKAKNQDLARTWYVQGIAEVFSMHTWQAGELELGVRRRVATIDLPGLAWELVRGVDRPWTEQRLELPCVRWAAAAYARDRHPEKFKKLALGSTGSKLSGEDFMNSLGASDAVGQGFREWLEASQAPLEVLTWSFEELADGRIVGRPARGQLAACRLKDRADSFEATIPLGPPEQGSGALVISCQEPLELEVARFTPGTLWIERYKEGETLGRESMPLPKSAKSSVRARLEREGGLVRVLAGDEILHEMPVEDPAFGLAALAADVVFEKVSWR